MTPTDTLTIRRRKIWPPSRKNEAGSKQKQCHLLAFLAAAGLRSRARAYEVRGDQWYTPAPGSLRADICDGRLCKKPGGRASNGTRLRHVGGFRPWTLRHSAGRPYRSSRRRSSGRDCEVRALTKKMFETANQETHAARCPTCARGDGEARNRVTCSHSGLEFLWDGPAGQIPKPLQRRSVLSGCQRANARQR